MTDPRKAHDAEPTTHFGYKSVPERQEAQKVAEVFHLRGDKICGITPYYFDAAEVAQAAGPAVEAA